MVTMVTIASMPVKQTLTSLLMVVRVTIRSSAEKLTIFCEEEMTTIACGVATVTMS
jgi:hypothetical protein